MCAASPEMKPWAGLWRYQSMAFIHHYSTNIIFSVLTHTMRSAMDPPARMERALSYYGVNIIDCLVARAYAWSDLVISFLCTYLHWFFWKTPVRGCSQCYHYVKDIPYGSGWIPPHMFWCFRLLHGWWSCPWLYYYNLWRVDWQRWIQHMFWVRGWLIGLSVRQQIT